MEAANKRRGLLRSFLAPAPPSLTRERLRAAVTAASKRRRRLRRTTPTSLFSPTLAIPI